MKVGNTITLNELEFTIVVHEMGVDGSDKHIDTKIVITGNDSRLVIHAYNSTQNLMVQGKNHENFAVGCLEPFIRKKIEESREQIVKTNNDIKETLLVETQSKAKNNRNCPLCNYETNGHVDLKVHMKSCHTKPNIISPKRNKILRTNNSTLKELIYCQDPLPLKRGPSAKIGMLMPEVQDLYSCDICEYTSITRDELKIHTNSLHSQDIDTDCSTPSSLRQLTMSPETIEGSVILKKCNNCDFQSPYDDDLRVHDQLEHKLTLINLEIRPIEITCDKCNM